MLVYNGLVRGIAKREVGSSELVVSKYVLMIKSAEIGNQKKYIERIFKNELQNGRTEQYRKDHL